MFRIDPTEFSWCETEADNPSNLPCNAAVEIDSFVISFFFPGSVCNDQEDVFDCDVNGPALAALGRALGLHTEDPPTSDSDSDSSSDDGGDVRMKDSGARPSASAKGPEKDPDTADGEPGKGIGSMTQSDLVWW